MTTDFDHPRAPLPKPRRVILESPYAGKSRWRFIAAVQRWRNVRYARACVRDSLMRGEAPIASHLLYTQRGVLKDGVPAERQHGINAGLAWLIMSDGSVVYVDRGISRGMRYGIEAALRAGRRVEYRRLGWAATGTAVQHEDGRVTIQWSKVV